MFIKIESEQLERSVRGLQEFGRDTSPAMQTVSAFFKQQTQLAFSQSQSPDGESWPALTSRVGQALRDTGVLLGSITGDFGHNFAEVGTNKTYAKTHQFGAHIKAKNGKYLKFPIANTFATVESVTIPQRAFFPLGPELPDSWEAGAQKIIDDQMLEAADLA